MEAQRQQQAEPMKSERSRLRGVILILVTVIVSVLVVVAIGYLIVYLLALGLTEGSDSRKFEKWSQSVLAWTILGPSLEWTPDGEYVIFTTSFSYLGEGSSYLIRSDGSEVNRISKGEDDRYVAEAGHDISNDGTRLVFITSRHRKGEAFDLEISNLDGSDRRRLTEEGIEGGSPKWSPDGTLIAYVDGDIEIIRADGSHERTIGFSGIIGPDAGRGPVWSPDGGAIAFVARASRFSAADEGAILYAISADGSKRQKAFTTPFLASSNQPISSPSWSPDGKYLAFALYQETEDKKSENGLYMVKSDGTELRRLAALPGRVASIDWSPDGKEILTGNGLIVNLENGETRKVLPTGLSQLAVFSPNGSKIAILTKGNQLLMADRDGSNRRNLSSDS